MSQNDFFLFLALVVFALLNVFVNIKTARSWLLKIFTFFLLLASLAGCAIMLLHFFGINFSWIHIS